MKGVPSSVTFSVGMTLAEAPNAKVVQKIDRRRRRFMVVVVADFLDGSEKGESESKNQRSMSWLYRVGRLAFAHVSTPAKIEEET